ncbi:MAG: folate-binding protein [Mariprofundaceae bacterium]|nr:folate-binding protein [Mariprofundaceae bacterium]
MLRSIMFNLSTEESAALQHGHLTCLRDEYVIIKASGATVPDYLQGQITQDIHRLTESCGIYTAILTPQGKLVSDLYIIYGHNRELIIIARKHYAEALVGRLRRFSLGHELRVGIVDSLKLISVQGDRCDDFLQRHHLPVPAESRLSMSSVAGSEQFIIRMAEAAGNGVWIVTDNTTPLLAQPEHPVDETTIRAARIIRGIPACGIDWNEKIFPLNANLIEFEGVSFEKGCYVGQEVTSRMQWRGGIKKRLYRVRLESLPSTLPCPLSTTVEVGMVTSAAMHGDEVSGIAHLPIEIVENRTPLIDPEGDSVQVIEACHG